MSRQAGCASQREMPPSQAAVLADPVTPKVRAPAGLAAAAGARGQLW